MAAPSLPKAPSPRPLPDGYEHPKLGKLFDRGFHCDLRDGSVPLSMLIVFLEAKIMVAKAALSSDPEGIVEEQREALRKHEERLREAEKLFGRERGEASHELLRKYKEEVDETVRAIAQK